MTCSTSGGDLHQDHCVVPNTALEEGDVPERPQFSIDGPIQGSQPLAGLNASEKGATDHRVVEARHVGPSSQSQAAAAVVEPRHRAQLA